MNIPLNIDWQQILLHLFNFAILAGGLYLLLFKPVKDFMDKRRDYYQTMDDNANAKLSEADDLKAKYQEKLDKADDEIVQIKKDAMAKTQAETDEQLADAKKKADKMMADAKVNIERERNLMIEESKKEVAGLAIEATKKILAQSKDDAYGSFLSNVDGGDQDDKS